MKIYKNGTFYVGSPDMWGNYSPETGEYYLARDDADPGEYVEVLASGCVGDDEWQGEAVYGYSYYGYSYEVVRELLQLGHLTKETLATFLDEGGEVWWNQPNF